MNDNKHIDFIRDFNPRKLFQHIFNYLSLFYKPIQTWNKVIDMRVNGYDIIGYHIFYYSIIVFIFVGDLSYRLLLQYVILEVGMTSIPFLVYFIPYQVFSKRHKSNLRNTNFFFLLLIFKLQIAPLIILLVSFYRWSSFEPVYIIVDNLLWILWLMYMLIPPIIIAPKIWQKIRWILLNYVLSSICVLLIAVTIEKTNFPLEKVNLNTPNFEYVGNLLATNNATDVLMPNYYMIITEIPLNHVRTQFVTYGLMGKFIDAYSLRDGLLGSISSTDNPLNKNVLDEFNNVFSKEFFDDLSFISMQKDSLSFESNRKYFSALYEYLYSYQKPFYDLDLFWNIQKAGRKPYYIRLQEGYYVFLYETYCERTDALHSKYVDIRDKNERRLNIGFFINDILYFPLYLLK